MKTPHVWYVTLISSGLGLPNPSSTSGALVQLM